MTNTQQQPSFQNSLLFKVLVVAAILGIALYQAWEKSRSAPSADVTSTTNNSESSPVTVNSQLEKLRPIEKPAQPKPTATPISENAVATKTVTAKEPVEKAVAGIKTRIANQSIRDLDGNVVYKGEIDLTKTIARIERGEVLEEFRHDGITFENREKRLPREAPGYYREWVHVTPQVRGPGPQRVISSKRGEYWYTPNHYSSFIKLN